MPASHRHTIAPPFRLYAVAVLLVVSGGCATPTQRSDDTTAATTAGQTGADADIARLRAAGDYRGASRRLLDQAAQAQPPQRETLLIAAVEMLLQGSLTDEAAALLEKLPVDGGADYRTRRILAEAHLLLLRAQPQAALQRLAGISEEIAPERMVEFHRLRAAAYSAAGNHLESARERVWLDGLLPENERPGNHQAIWESLARLPDAVLANMRSAPPPDVFSGWLELVETTRAVRDNPQQLDIALAIWRERYPEHPAAARFIAGMQTQLTEYNAAAQPGQIAVLLPLTGPLAEAGQAVRDGMLAAYFHGNAGGTTQLRFHDTGARTVQQTLTLYQQVVSEGAQQVIGPLTKEAVAALAASGMVTVPVLALNNLSGAGSTPEQFYQFGLSPEDEAVQVAERAWRDGRRNALALVPETAWGERVYQAFANEWQSLGGSLLKRAAYDDDERSYSGTVRELLSIDAGAQRHQALIRQIGQRPEYEPQPRQDADFLFLAANAPQARMIRPLLRYHHADALPVYSTSQIHEGFDNASLDRDMDGIRFCDMPWMLPSNHPLTALRGDIARLWPAREQRYARLYALGIDALQIAPYLQGLRDGTFARHPGVSGDLYLDKERRVHRDLQWAEFRNGLPVALPDTPAAPAAPVPPGLPGLPAPADPPPVPNSLTQDHTDAYPATAAAPGAGRAR
ncbi:MAG TPA: penicillin-binding protein activator [Gammaproteobacteria bacterium]